LASLLQKGQTRLRAESRMSAVPDGVKMNTTSATVYPGKSTVVT